MHRTPSSSPFSSFSRQEGTLQAPGAQHSELAQALMLLIPTAFDLIATVLMNVGLLSGG